MGEEFGSLKLLLAADLAVWAENVWSFVKVLIGFSIIIFVHELGHFLAAKWVGVRVDRFAVGFGTRVFGWRQGEGLTFGNRPNYKPEELKEKNYGETDYCFKALPFGGYVKMLGQDDIQINDDTGEIKMSDDPRAFTNKPVGQRMIVVSAGVVFNALFAILMLAAVFMVGKRENSPVIGLVVPDSPAAHAGLMPGDRVVSVNGEEVDAFKDIIITQMLSQGPMTFDILRQRGDGEPVKQTIVVQRPEEGDMEAQMLGVWSMTTTELLADGEPVDDRPIPKKGDVITHVEGKPVNNEAELRLAFARAKDELVELTVEPGPNSEDLPPTRYQRSALLIESANPLATSSAALADDRSVLGLQQRRKIAAVIDGAPADEAGFEKGDVIVQWGTQTHPLYSEIVDSIQANERKPIPVVVLRDGEERKLAVTPRRPFQFFGEAKAQVGLSFQGGEERRVIVASVQEGSPAAALGMPRGSEIVAVDDQPVASWFDLVRAFEARAGQTVTVRFRSGAELVDGQMAIPSSIVNELDLKPGATILSLSADGQTIKTIELTNGTLTRVSSQAGLRRALEQLIGQTITVRYALSPTSNEVREAEFAVREGNTDPWQMRINYGTPMQFVPQTDLIQTNNPIVALGMGTQYTGEIIVGVYQFFKLMARKTESVQHVSGPVGIFGHAIERAKQGYSELFYFLAFLSANLAVINFLPLPVVDGGLMVFLIIEKIKGSPLSIKTQMISTMVGLAAIVLVFLLITIQDITRLFGAS